MSAEHEELKSLEAVLAGASPRDLQLARRLVDEPDTEYDRIVASHKERIEAQRHEAEKAYEVAITKGASLDHEIAAVTEQLGKEGLVAWLKLPWYALKSAGLAHERQVTTARAEKYAAKTISAKHDIIALEQSREKRGALVREELLERVEVHRREVYGSELMTILKMSFGHHREYGTDGFREWRVREADWSLELYDSAYLGDGIAVAVTQYRDRCGGERRTYYRGYVIDLDRKRRIGDFAAGSPLWIGGSYRGIRSEGKKEGSLLFRLFRSGEATLFGVHSETGALKEFGSQVLR